MPGGIEINSNTTRIREAFQQYAMYNKRNRETLFRDQARKLAVELYNQTAAIAPSEDDIAAKVRSLGWRIPKNFADGRIARGTKEQWVGVDWERRKPKRRRGRPTKRSAAAYQAKMDWFFQDYYERPTLDQMQQFVIMMRTQARLYLASGWLGAVVDLGGQRQGQQRRREPRPRRGVHHPQRRAAGRDPVEPLRRHRRRGRAERV